MRPHMYIETSKLLYFFSQIMHMKPVSVWCAILCSGSPLVLLKDLPQSVIPQM